MYFYALLEKALFMEATVMKYIPESSEIHKEIDTFFSRSIPSSIPEANCGLGNPLSEIELRRYFNTLAQANEGACMLSFLGGGAYDHYIPSIIPVLAARSEFLTSYTQYQPELSQGMLQALFEYQNMIAELLCMDVVNASMYDVASALAEAVLMAMRIHGGKKQHVLLSPYIRRADTRVVATYCGAGAGLLMSFLPRKGDGTTMLDVLEKIPVDNNVACVVFQNPNCFGILENLEGISEILAKRTILFILSTYPLALGIIKTPGELGADIVVGDTQSLGIPLGFGGPYAGIFSAKAEFVRQMPGRLVGETVDAEGRRAYTLTLNSREQHIRRGQATSNICTNQALCALMSAIYLTAMGKEGMREVARQCTAKAHYLAKRILGCRLFGLKFSAPFFNEFLVKTNLPTMGIQEVLEKRGILALFRNPSCNIPKNTFLVAVTEKRTKEELDFLVETLQEIQDENTAL